MKHFGVLTFIVVVASCSIPCYGVNFTHGMIEPEDRLIYHEYIVVEPELNRMVTRNVTYPPKGFKPSKQRIISAVQAFDLNTERVYGSGFASILSGGPKYPNLNLQLKSFRNLGLNFSVEIWGQ